jgi:hypothetical protein
MKAVSALQKKAAHPRQRKNNITKMPLIFTINAPLSKRHVPPDYYQL